MDYYCRLGENGRIVEVLGEYEEEYVTIYPDGTKYAETKNLVVTDEMKSNGWILYPDVSVDYRHMRYEDGEFIFDPLPDPLDPGEVLKNMLDNMTDVVENMPDDVISRMEAYFYDWQEDCLYLTGKVVVYGEYLYRCLQDHTSQPAWTPDISPSLWARVLTDPSGEILPWVQPDSTNPYMKGDKVTHNSHTWESLVDNNVWEPGVYGWRLYDE